jgi:hypothetical protein
LTHGEGLCSVAFVLPASYAEPTWGPPYRILVLLAATQGWYEADLSTRDRALEALSELFATVEAEGARLVGSVDDDLFATGQPLSLPYSIYVLYDVDDLGIVVRMTQRLRASELARLFRCEARVGRSLFLLSN